MIAYAGTGKTTTLQMISDAMPERRGMYLAFNKAIAGEAQNKFHRNVDCRTFHSLAFRSVPRGVTDKLRLPRLSPSFIAKEYRLEPITLRRMMGGRYEKYVLMPSRLASLVANAVSYFCSTSSQYPAPRHIQAPNWLHPDDITALQTHLYPAVERRWLESIDPNHQAGIGHDIYLKLWALSEPNIPADYVLFDEAQDADPLMLGILLRQKYSGYLCRRCTSANLRVARCSKCHATAAFARVSLNDLFSFWGGNCRCRQCVIRWLK